MLVSARIGGLACKGRRVERAVLDCLASWWPNEEALWSVHTADLQTRAGAAL